MSRPIVRFLFAAAIGFFAGAAFAQTPAVDALLTKANEFAAQGKYAEAIEAAGKALISAEHEYGTGDQRLVKPLKTLARLFELEREYAKAETQYSRALSIVERTAGPKSDAAAELKMSLLAISLKKAAPAPSNAPRSHTRSLRAAPSPTVTRSLQAKEAETIPFFPWPPPAPSASYVFLPNVFSQYETAGEVSNAILTALERSGYVERSFFQTRDGGVALVTRLERISTDGSPASETERWPAGFDNTPAGFVDFIRGLFYAKAGHYRVIVFVLQEKSFTVSQGQATAQDAEGWLNGGFNTLPAAFARVPFGPDSTCTALIYEFASDGANVKSVVSALTGKQHLEKSGLMAALAKPE